MLLAKKRYVGFSYESPGQAAPTFDAKGIETVRRDTCGAVAKMMERSIRILFATKDLSQARSQRSVLTVLDHRHPALCCMCMLILPDEAGCISCHRVVGDKSCMVRDAGQGLCDAAVEQDPGGPRVAGRLCVCKGGALVWHLLWTCWHRRGIVAGCAVALQWFALKMSSLPH